MRVIPCLLAAAGLLLAAAPAADAQVQLQGRVIDDAGEQPIGGADVLLQDARGRRLAQQITDEAGEFLFEVDGKRPVRLRVDRIGYQRTLTPVLELDGYVLFRLEVRLGVAAVPLAPLEVVARSRSAVSPTLSGFETRRLAGLGWFITREEIERRNPSRTSDLLVNVPGVVLQPAARNSNRRIVYMARGSLCPAQIFVDGFHINRHVAPVPGRRGLSTTEMFPIDDVVIPSSIHGIEVYQGLSRLPAEFVTPEASCGVVAIWTRRGGD